MEDVIDLVSTDAPNSTRKLCFPTCLELFPPDTIEVHADECAEKQKEILEVVIKRKNDSIEEDKVMRRNLQVLVSQQTDELDRYSLVGLYWRLTPLKKCLTKLLLPFHKVNIKQIPLTKK